MKTRTWLAAIGTSLIAGSSHAQPRNPAATAAHTQSAQSSLAAAVALATASDYANAERELSAIKGADQPAAQLALARVYLEQGKFAEADRAAQQAASTQTEAAAARSASANLPCSR
jgi:hypothetical protein